MEGISFALLEIGHGENDADYNFCGYSFGDTDNRTPKHVWMKFPYFCVLVKHPDVGYFLFDCGPGIGSQNGRRSPDAVRINPAFIKREEFLDRHLERLGIGVNEIRQVIISHAHWDHIGGLDLLKGSDALGHVMISRQDFANGLIATHRNACGYSDHGYYRDYFETPEVSFELIDSDMELYRGVELVLFEGHTPGVIGLILHCKEKTYIFPSDAVTSRLCYGPPIVYPSMIADSKGYVSAIEKLRRLEKKYHAEIIFSHDPWQFPTLKKAPFFYEG